MTSEVGIRLRFKREERLKRAGDIRDVFSKGKKVSCSGAKLFYSQREEGVNRIVVTFSRKFGTAVQRNQARRYAKEAYRLMKNGIHCSYDFVLLLYSGKYAYLDRKEQLECLFSKARLIVRKQDAKTD